MAWNDPKDQKPDDYDPWTGQPKNKSNQTPPLLEDFFKQLFRKIAAVPPGGKKEAFHKFSAQNGLLLLLALIVMGWLLLGLFQINRDQQALIFRFGAFQKSLSTGLYWRPWGIYTVQRFDREEKINQTVATDVISQDANLAHIAITLSYHVNNPEDYVLRYANIQQLIQTLGVSVLQQTAAQNKLDTILANAKNATFNMQLQRNLGSVLTNAETGVQLDQVELVTIAVPDSIKYIFDKIDALYDQQSKQRQAAADYERTHIPPAEAKGVAQIAAANVFAEQTKRKAMQDVADFLAIFPVYKQNPRFTRYQLYSQTMQDILSKTTHVVVDEKAGGTAFYLPIPTSHSDAPSPAIAKVEPSLSVDHPDNTLGTDSSEDSYGNLQGGY